MTPKLLLFSHSNTVFHCSAAADPTQIPEQYRHRLKRSLAKQFDCFARLVHIVQLGSHYRIARSVAIGNRHTREER